ncbi:MAG: glycosyltransferase [Planctomycetaceae bacterium]|jgi:glycosyltransferase involved in cell wall biosynthesis|nr:glycosyltransferase [Planctomycetaceae bacterium]
MISKIKLALVITELNVGGAELIFTELATRLDRTRFEPVVYSLQPRPNAERSACVQTLENAGIEIHFLDIQNCHRFCGINLAFSYPVQTLNFFRLLRKQKPDVVLSFLFHANMLCRQTALLYKFASHRPVFISGVRVAEHGKCWHRILDKCTKNLADRFVCVSEQVAMFCRERIGVAENKIIVIPNGIDTTLYENIAPADISNIESIQGSKKAIFVGRFHKQKGLDWLVTTLPQSLGQLGDWELMLVGDGEEKQTIKNQIEKQCDKELAKRVHVIDWRPDIPALLAASDLLILPSRWEGMPNIIMQAMASSLPVLATKAEGVYELLNDERQTTQFGDTEQWCKKFQQITQSKQLREELAARNHERVKNKFQLEQMITQYIAIIQHR